jgi:hypothetical protein
MSMRGSAESDGDSRALASVSDGRFVLCASVFSFDVLGVEAEEMTWFMIANAVLCGIGIGVIAYLIVMSNSLQRVSNRRADND